MAAHALGTLGVHCVQMQLSILGMVQTMTGVFLVSSFFWGAWITGEVMLIAAAPSWSERRLTLLSAMCARCGLRALRPRATLHVHLSMSWALLPL